MANMNYTDTRSDMEMSARTAIDYELAGRFPSQTFKDLRSASKARRRQRANLEKYYSYRGVNAGQVGQQYHKLPSNFNDDKALPAEAPTVTMTKQNLYREAQCYPRPPTYHRRTREYARWTKTCRKDKERRARRHASQQLSEDVDECSEYYFMAYVAGHGKERDLDDHVFRRCDVCWAELQDWYILDQMFDSNGEAIGRWEDQWHVSFEGMEAGEKFGFAGRAKVGDLFLMGDEDWRHQPLYWIDGVWFEGCEGSWYEDECAGDVAFETWSWSDVLSVRGAVDDAEAEWDMVSPCSSWSHVE